VTQKYVFHSTPLGENLLPRHHLMAFGKQFFQYCCLEFGAQTTRKTTNRSGHEKAESFRPNCLAPLKIPSNHFYFLWGLLKNMAQKELLRNVFLRFRFKNRKQIKKVVIHFFSPHFDSLVGRNKHLLVCHLTELYFFQPLTRRISELIK
jgi:hypothetical protein